MRSCRRFLLSSLWRPHSEQIKFWVASSATDQGALQLARTYVHDLELKNVVITVDDALELVNILQKIKYPHGSHVATHLARHFEATSDELCAKDVRQLIADARVTDADLTYYEATLASAAFYAALTRCIQTLEDEELIDLVTPFCEYAAIKGPQTSQVALRISLIVAQELGMRVRASRDAFAMLVFIARHKLPLETLEWEGLNALICEQTTYLSKSALRTLLQTLAEYNFPYRHSAWADAVQAALLKSDTIAQADLCDIALSAICAGCRVDDTIVDQLTKNVHLFSSERVIELLRAWQDARFSASSYNTFSAASQERLEVCFEGQVRRTGTQSLSLEHLTWLYCLSFLSEAKAASFLASLNTTTKDVLCLSATEAALLCRILIKTGVSSPSLVDGVCLHAKSDIFGQEDSIALFHFYQKTGKRAPEKLLKSATGRPQRRLLGSRGQKQKANSVLSFSNMALLLAGLAFVDDGEQVLLLKRLLQSEQVTPAVALTVLRYTRSTKTKSCHLVKARLVQKLVEAARTLSADDLRLTMTTMADLRIRDAAAFERLLRELERRKVSVRDVVAAGSAAKALGFSSLFAQLSVTQAPHKLPGVTPAELLSVLQCCGAERRHALLKDKEVRDMVDNFAVTDAAVPDLVQLFIVSTCNEQRRAAIVNAMATCDPVSQHDVEVDDVISALECARAVREIEVVCRLCANAAGNLDERQLMRLLRRVQWCSPIPNKLLRFAGRAILRLSAQDSLSPGNALHWTKLYVDHRIRDDAVGKCLVAQARRLRTGAPPELTKYVSKAVRLYGNNASKK